MIEWEYAAGRVTESARFGECVCAWLTPKLLTYYDHKKKPIEAYRQGFMAVVYLFILICLTFKYVRLSTACIPFIYIKFIYTSDMMSKLSVNECVWVYIRPIKINNKIKMKKKNSNLFVFIVIYYEIIIEEKKRSYLNTVQCEFISLLL